MPHSITSLFLLAVLLSPLACREGESQAPPVVDREPERVRSDSPAAGSPPEADPDRTASHEVKKSILVSSWPAEGTSRLPLGEWLQLEFASPITQNLAMTRLLTGR
ncbi:MAG: hypothetical protein QF570_22300 [Myxococcota bacterium]|jgi:hypothetical protein|nr:hypothetical protein [Myxococcota bacterium]